MVFKSLDARQRRTLSSDSPQTGGASLCCHLLLGVCPNYCIEKGVGSSIATAGGDGAESPETLKQSSS